MGQRSQIYVRYNDESGDTALIARYYGWNYGERMISRARWACEWLKEHISGESPNNYLSERTSNSLVKVLETNFDMHDVLDTLDIIKEFNEYGDGDNFNDFVFNEHCNDGKLLLDVLSTGEIKYAFLDYDNNLEHIMNAEQYMNWDIRENWRTPTDYFDADDIAICEENIKKLNEHATYMTAEEVSAFLDCDYSLFYAKKYEENQKKKTDIERD